MLEWRYGGFERGVGALRSSLGRNGNCVTSQIFKTLFSASSS
jgi:hypothetical protein